MREAGLDLRCPDRRIKARRAVQAGVIGVGAAALLLAITTDWRGVYVAQAMSRLINQAPLGANYAPVLQRQRPAGDPCVPCARVEVCETND
jgi:hypothetical protein